MNSPNGGPFPWEGGSHAGPNAPASRPDASATPDAPNLGDLVIEQFRQNQGLPPSGAVSAPVDAERPRGFHPRHS